MVVRPVSGTEALWAAEQALGSGVCAAVLLWLKGTDDRWLRRLKLAAEAGRSLGVLFRPERHRFESSPAALRLLLTRGDRYPRLDIIKVQGGRPGPVDLDSSRRRAERQHLELTCGRAPPPWRICSPPPRRRPRAPLRRTVGGRLAAASAQQEPLARARGICGTPWCFRHSAARRA